MWRKQSNLIQPDWWETTSQNVLAHVDKNTISHIIRQSDDMVDNLFIMEGANKQVISSQVDSLIKISRIWANFFPANTSNQPI